MGKEQMWERLEELGESETSRCLYDMCELKKAEPEKWMYRLDGIYNKYGIDTVNKVREGVNL